jgi:predicted LPLAT superfamily acyltransferase
MSEHWRDQRERGSENALRIFIWLALYCGRTLCRVLAVPISAYFLLTAPLARHSSRAFMSRALGRRATWRDTFKHFFVFGTTMLDRIYLLNGRQRELTVEVSNEQAFWHALAAGRGCLLLGSHLGSFEMLSIIGSVEKKLTINVVMHLSDNERVRALLAASGRQLPYNVIPLGHPGSMLRVRECLERGEVVGMLADRVYGDEPTQSVPFLGRPARFSLGPLRLARITGAPVVMVFGLFCGGRRYEIDFEPLVERIDDSAQAMRGRESDSPFAAPPDQRRDVRGTGEQCTDDTIPSGLAPHLQSYVASLERHARHSPYNWFNFYDYWSA